MYNLAIRIASIILPTTILLVVFIIYTSELTQLPGIISLSLPYWPIVLFAISGTLAWTFNNTREFNIVILLVLFLFSINLYYWDAPADFSRYTFLAGLALLIPINIILQHSLVNRGIFTRHNLSRIGTITLSFLILLILTHTHAKEITPWILYKPHPFSFLYNTSLTFLSLLVSGICIFYLFWRGQSSGQNPVLSSGISMALVCTLVAIHFIKQPHMVYFLLSAAGLALVIALLINSYSLAYLDELTGLPTRRALKQHMLTLGKHYCIAMVDIDHFKKLNDTYGHDVGDQVLRMVATHLQRVQGGGKAFRYGGEEFTITFPNKDKNEAAIHADNLRQAIASSPFKLRGKDRPRQKPEQPRKKQNNKLIPVTVSIGVSEKRSRHGSPDAVMKDADTLLYKSKENGRNRVS